MATTKVDDRLPELEDGELAQVVSIKLMEKTTRPPSHYTEGTLLDDMRAAGKFIENDPELRKVLKEVSGLGTAATRDATIEGLKHDRYIEKVGKHLKATPKGIAFINWLKSVAPEITDVATTARWEAELEVVAKSGGGAAFEARIAAMVKDLVSKLKTAPALGLTSPSSSSSKPSSKETSRMSEAAAGARSSAPTPKMLEYARNIAQRIGQEVSPEVVSNFEACRDFIEANKDAAMRPTDKQLKFATSIAERKGLTIPENTLKNGKELSAWIDANK